MELSVFIPTRGRVGLSKQITLREMTSLCKRYSPVIVCPPDEVMKHAAYHPKGSVGVLGCPVEGIGPTRHWILTEAAAYRGVVMLDDDLYFARRTHLMHPIFYDRALDKPHEDNKLIQCDELDSMFDWISEQLDAGFVHGGIAARQGSQFVTMPWNDCTRVNNAHFFDSKVYNAEGIKFDRLPVMEDFDVTLGLLLKGYPNRVLYHHVWSQRGSGLEGGCSLYRTAEVQAKAAFALKELYPEWVRVVDKVSTAGGSVFGGEARKDVNIDWLKAWRNRPVEKGQFLEKLPELDMSQRKQYLTKEQFTAWRNQ